MPKQLYVPYIIFALLGIALLALSLTLMGREAALSTGLPLIALGGVIFAIAANRMFYLHAADAVIAKVEPLERDMTPIALGFGLVYISIEDIGDYRIDQWHTKFDDTTNRVLSKVEKRKGVVFIDPSDSLPVAVKIDEQLLLLEGSARKRPLLANPLMVQQLKESSEQKRIGIGGWLLVLQLIFLWCGVTVNEYFKIHDYKSVEAALLFIPKAIVYFFPFIIGSYNRCKHGDINFAINLFLGWTVVGWFVVLYRVWNEIKNRSFSS